MSDKEPGRGRRGPKRKPYLPSKRDLEIFDLRHTTRYSYKQIGDKFDLSVAGVHKICKKVQEWTKLQHMDDALLTKATSTRIYEKVMLEAFEAWEKSKKTRRKTRNKTVTGGKDGDKSEYEEVDEDAYGDPNLLKVVLEARGRIDKAWGADQPPEITVSASTRVAGANPDDAVLALQQDIQLIMTNLPNAQQFLEQLTGKPQGGGDVIDGDVVG